MLTDMAACCSGSEVVTESVSTAEVESSSRGPSLLSKLKAPTKSNLARKRKIEKPNLFWENQET